MRWTVVTLMTKNCEKIKIVLQKGGFAGDLITSLYDPTSLINLDSNGKINIHPSRTLLQNKNNLSLENKNKLLDQFPLLSVCDTEFAFMHRKKTLFLYSSKDEMTKFFCKRFYKFHPDHATKKSMEDHILEHNQWRAYWIDKFQFSLDVSYIFEKGFLSKIPFLKVDEKKSILFEKWKYLNRSL